MIPTRSEVSGWSPERLADFLRKSRLQGCDRVVLQHRINGDRFMNLSDNDLLKFPTTSCPMISKLRADIRKQSGKRSFFSFGQSKRQQTVESEADEGGWGEDEFDDDYDQDFDDDDYEEPGSEDDGNSDDYEDPDEEQAPDTSPADQPRPWTQTRTQTRTRTRTEPQEEDRESDYEPPPSEPCEDFKLPSVSLGDGDYIDSHVSSRGPPPAVCPRPPAAAPHRRPTESRRDLSPHPLSANKPTAKLPPQVPPQVCRANKPGRDPGSNQSPNRGPPRSTAGKLQPQPWSRPQDPPEPQTQIQTQIQTQTRTKAPLLIPSPVLNPASVNRSNSGARTMAHRFDSRREPQPAPDEDVKRNTFPLHNKSPRPGLPPVRHTDSFPPGASSTTNKAFTGGSAPSSTFRPPPPPQVFSSNQDLDSVWYVGSVTRREAEASLRRLGKDGCFLVRDSTRQSSVQPFTLMVLFQHKVYNIQIQVQDHKYLLGTGLKVQESFPSVRGIVDYFSQFPLLLIDAKNRDSDRHQCLLSDPAGAYINQL